MRFLIDEDIPIKLIKALSALNHDTIRVTPASSDMANALRAKEENRILITLDKDFTNFSLFPPSKFNIIHVNIHPPYAENIIAAVKKLLETCPDEELTGLIILTQDGHFKIF